MEYLKHCPVCDSESLIPFLEIKDHFLSQEIFHIQECHSCGLRFTNPRPDFAALSSYYESEDYISHSNRRNNLQDTIYQLARRISINRKYRLIRNFAEKGKILDVGCGTGEFLGLCQTKGWETTGIEPNPGARQQAINNHGLKVEEESFLSRAAAASFDVISLWHVLEHVPDLKGRISELVNLLRPGGMLLIAVPNSSSHDALKYGKYWAAYDVPRHLWHFTPGSMSHLMQRFPLKADRILPMKLDAYYISLLSEKYKNGKPSWAASLLTGLTSNSKAGRDGNYSSLIYRYYRQSD